MMQESQPGRVALFEGKRIRKVFHGGEWWFSIIDVIEVLTDSSIPKRYWFDLKKKLAEEGATETYEKIVRLRMPASDGKLRLTDCADTELRRVGTAHRCQGVFLPVRILFWWAVPTLRLEETYGAWRCF